MLPQKNNLTYFVILMNERSLSELARVLEQETKTFAYSLVSFAVSVYLYSLLDHLTLLFMPGCFCQMVSYVFGLISSFRSRASSWRARYITANHSRALPLCQTLLFHVYLIFTITYIYCTLIIFILQMWKLNHTEINQLILRVLLQLTSISFVMSAI